MNNRLPSGSFAPSGLLEVETEKLTGFNQTFNNVSLKMGHVVAVYETTDKGNLNGVTPEYDVVVQERRDQSAPTPITYKNCVMADLFGGAADFMEYRLRGQETVEKKEKSGEKIARFQDGSIVLLMCLNGFNETAIIIGGAKHPKRKTKLTKDAGHAFAAEFNGLSIDVDKEGALTIGFKGATDNAGKAKSASVGGSFIKIKKDGSVEVSDGKKESLALDKTAQTAALSSGKDTSINAGGKLDVKSGDAATFKVGKSLAIEAQGSCSLKASELSVESKGPVKIKGASLEAQIDGAVKLKGSQITLDGMTFLGGAGGTPALTLSTMFIGTGNMGIPVISQAIGPFSSKVFVSS
jgi:hypothetical protein